MHEKISKHVHIKERLGEQVTIPSFFEAVLIVEDFNSKEHFYNFLSGM